VQQQGTLDPRNALVHHGFLENGQMEKIAGDKIA